VERHVMVRNHEPMSLPSSAHKRVQRPAASSSLSSSSLSSPLDSSAFVMRSEENP